MLQKLNVLVVNLDKKDEFYIAEILETKRIEIGMNWQQLANRLKVSAKYVEDVECYRVEATDEYIIKFHEFAEYIEPFIMQKLKNETNAAAERVEAWRDEFANSIKW